MSSSSNVFKSGAIVLKKDEKRVIDSNDLIAARMQKLAEILEMDSDGDFADDFSVGLDAHQVEALLGDQDDADDGFSEGLSGNVLKEIPAAPAVNTDELIEQAQEEARRITDEASAEADRILEQAAREAENVKENAFKQGSEAGYQDGLQKAETEYAAKEQELLKRQEALEAEYREKRDVMETGLVEELTDVFEHVLGISLSDQSEVVLHLMKDAIRNIEGGRNFFAHVSPQDYAYVSAYREDIQNSVGGVDSVEIVEDVTLKPSDCYIECESGIYECGLGTELSLLKKELRLLSYHK
ncbi:MAG: hypothetical protein K6G83_13165 [Lachnospiraceae bacterium]|nr:hypothetical protein [Lachnospiraceae bacterium]